jgi:nucleotide-binding universal stress UspA family protein
MNRCEQETNVIAPRTIVVATDFGDAASRALDYGIEFARAFGARVHVVHVADDLAAGAVAVMGAPPIDVGAAQASVDDEARRTLAALITADEIQALDVHPVLLRDHQPARALLSFARESDADLIIIGTHGRGGLAEFFLGSAAQRVVRNAPCPVLTVRAAERDFVRPAAARSAVASTRLH